MRKLLLFLSIVLTVNILLTACSSNTDAPAKAVENYLTALVAKDADRLPTLVCGDWEADALIELEAKHPERLRVIHTLTREPDVALCGPSVRKGRVNADVLRELIPDLDSCVIYVCGPGISKFDREAAKEKGEQPQPRFLESVLADLKSLGVPNARIKRESYG